MKTRKTARRPVAALMMLSALGLAALGLAACEGAQTKEVYSRRDGSGNPNYTAEEDRETIFGQGGINLFGGDNKSADTGGGAGLGVNSFLWRASLDTISFMPVSSADPFGGVIITDWYAGTKTPNERFKLNVYILGRALRADGVRVAVFRQVRAASAAEAWSDAPVPDQAAAQIEDAILTRARQLRNQQLLR